MEDRSRVLVVGAGFAGATHARECADKGYKVHVIDKRPHVAGNAYDEIYCDQTRVHRYGPHLFHTNSHFVMEWISRFGKFVPYVHSVVAELSGQRCVPLPINRTTINSVFSLTLETEEQVANFLAEISVRYDSPRNAAEYLYSKIGRELTELFFRPYTRKMWDLDLEDLHESVVRRIPLRFDDDNRYFPNDEFQVLPYDGYTELVKNILDHTNITISLDTAFEHTMANDYEVCFNSMPIDEYCDSIYGPLPYRSIDQISQ
jgi:UDP-galactopyranose mutase